MELLSAPSWVTEQLQVASVSNGSLPSQQQGLPVPRKFGNRTALLDAIKSCGKQKDLHKGIRIHAYLLEWGVLDTDIGLCNALLSMYTKCGMLAKAQEIFDELPARSVVTWNALISGYAQQGLGHTALSCFEKMQDEGLSPNTVTFICILKACGGVGAIEKGEEIHVQIDKKGLLKKDVVLGSVLVDMYAKCGMLAKAQEVFDKLPARDTATWTVLIFGYIQQGLDVEALSCFAQMQREGISPDAVTYCCILKVCGRARAVKKGIVIHAEISEQGLLENDIDLNNAVVDMYAKCGMLAKAQDVFDATPMRNVVTWNVLIAGYAECGLGKEALALFQRMQHEDFSPNAVTFISILKACASIGAIDKGKEIHSVMRRLGLVQNDVVLGTTLVDMYAKCGGFAEAKEVFDELATPNIATWTALIAGYVQHGLGNEAFTCYRRMKDEGITPNEVTFICILKACGSIGAIEKGEEVHAEIDSQGLLKRDVALGTALIDMYVKCGFLTKAHKVLDQLPARNVATWTALISGYAEHGLGEKAWDCFEQMQEEGLSPNIATFLCILKACGSIGAVDKGEEIHAELERQGLLQNSTVLSTALVDMYAKCGKMVKAHEVFTELRTQDVVSWTALIAGYAELGFGNEALSCFRRMKDEGILPNIVTFLFILKACANSGALKVGEEVHDELERKGLLENSIMLNTALVDMYAKGGALAKAQELFDELPSKDVALWNALIAGYAQHKYGEKSLRCFEKMQDEGVLPNASTIACALQACGSAGAVEKGEEIHAEVNRQGLLKQDIELGTALVDMYVKCGKLASAQELFDKLPARGLTAWTALISGYAQFGMAGKVSSLFKEMIGEGIEPSGVTFLLVLAACSHAGLLEEGQMYFDLMSNVYCIIPTLEHLTCMVDIFSRAGHFDKAVNIIRKVPPSDSLLLWLALMGACQRWANVEIGRLAFEQAVQVDKTLSATYICMSNIYAAAGMKEKAHEIEVLRMRNGA